MSEVKDTEQTTIDGQVYKVKLLGASRAFIIAQELAKLSLPSIGAAIDGMFQDAVWEDKQTFAEVALLLTGQLGTLDMLAIIKELLNGTTENDLPIDFETHFRGRNELLVSLVELALRGNFGSLFMKTSLGEKLKKFTEEFKNQTQTRKTLEDEGQQESLEK